MKKAISGPRSISSLTTGEGAFALGSGIAGFSMIVSDAWARHWGQTLGPNSWARYRGPEIRHETWQDRGSSQVIASNRQARHRCRQAIALQHPYLPPEEDGRERHHHEDLEQDPDVDACKHMIERDDVRIGKARSHGLIDDGGRQEKQRHVARELVPALFGVVEGVAKDKAKEALACAQPPPQQNG